MKKEISLKSGWIRIDKPELDKLRSKLRERYEFEGGRKKFNSHLDNYEELREMIDAKIDDLQNNQGVEIKINDRTQYDILPGNTFFRNLLYTNRKSKSLRFQEYNIEICYLYAYNMRRFDYLRKLKKKEIPEKPSAPTKDDYKFIISSSMNNMLEADKIASKLKEDFGFHVESDVRNAQAFSKGSLKDIYDNLDEKEIVIFVIGKDFLQNETCVKELIEVTKASLDKYLEHTFHVLLEDIYEGDFNIFEALGRSEILKYWKLRSEKLEENHKLILADKKDKKIYAQLSEELNEIKEIIVELNGALDLLRANKSKMLNKMFLEKVEKPEDFLDLLPRRSAVKPLNVKFEHIYKEIKVPSSNNPKKPEFPPLPFFKPKFPASQTYDIKVPGFNSVRLKDESSNPTGTHKDRFAWEVVIKYKSLIQGLKYKDFLPQMSLISSGSAAIAIQYLLNLYEIPAKLKVLIDENVDERIKNSIETIGCELYETDLSKKLLSSEEIKTLTENESGIDITYRETLDPNQDNYYDWMSYEILSNNYDYCFIPFGTGDLFINVLNIVKVEYFNSYISKQDPRFLGDIDSIKKCNFMGASTRNPETLMDKLYSSFLPSIDSFKKYIGTLRDEYGCVGSNTGFYYVQEKYVPEAMDICDKQKIKHEPSGIAGLALLLQMKEEIPKNSKILIVNTGKTKILRDLNYFDK